MSLLDLFSLAVLAVFFFLGRERGFAWQAAGLGSLVLGGLAARGFGADIAKQLSATSATATCLVWALVYAVVSLTIYLVALKYRRFLKEKDFTEFDKHLGGVVGAIKGALLLGLILLVVATLAPSPRARIFGTLTGKALAATASQFRSSLPTATVTALKPWIRESESPRIPGKRPTHERRTRVEGPGPLKRRSPLKLRASNRTSKSGASSTR